MRRLRPTFAPVALAVLAVLALGACGGEDEPSAGPDDSAAAVTTEASEPTAAPSGDGPFLLVERRIAVSVDGDVYRRTSEPAGVAPPIPDRPAAWEVARLTTAGLGELTSIVADLGFLDTPPDYGDLFVSDTDPFRLVVSTVEGEQVHELFMPEERLDDADANAARDRLAELVTTLEDIEDVVGDELGPFEPYVPEGWRVTAVRSDGTESPPWPFAEPATAGCTEFPDDDVTARGQDAATGRYRDPAETGDLDVDGLLPWETC